MKSSGPKIEPCGTARVKDSETAPKYCKQISDFCYGNVTLRKTFMDPPFPHVYDPTAPIMDF